MLPTLDRRRGTRLELDGDLRRHRHAAEHPADPGHRHLRHDDDHHRVLRRTCSPFRSPPCPASPRGPPGSASSRTAPSPRPRSPSVRWAADWPRSAAGSPRVSRSSSPTSRRRCRPTTRRTSAGSPARRGRWRHRTVHGAGAAAGRPTGRCRSGARPAVPVAAAQPLSVTTDDPHIRGWWTSTRAHPGGRRRPGNLPKTGRSEPARHGIR